MSLLEALGYATGAVVIALVGVLGMAFLIDRLIYLGNLIEKRYKYGWYLLYSWTLVLMVCIGILTLIVYVIGNGLLEVPV